MVIPGGEKHVCYLWHELVQLSLMRDRGENIEGRLMSNMAFQEAWSPGPLRKVIFSSSSLWAGVSQGSWAERGGKGEVVVNGRLSNASIGHLLGLPYREVEGGRSGIKICDDGVEEIQEAGWKLSFAKV